MLSEGAVMIEVLDSLRAQIKRADPRSRKLFHHLRGAVNILEDLAHGVLTLKRTKFYHSRLVPLHAGTRSVLSQYADFATGRFRRRLTDKCSFFPHAAHNSVVAWSTIRLLNCVTSSAGRRAVTIPPHAFKIFATRLSVVA